MSDMDHQAIDRVVFSLGRSLMQGMATDVLPDGGRRAWSTHRLCRHLRLVPHAIECTIARLRWTHGPWLASPSQPREKARKV